MASLYARGYRIFNFHDDNFFQQDRHLNLQRFWRLRGELQARSVGHIAFAVKSRPDIVDEETFAFLKDFGLFRVFLGIEAGTARSLGQLGRKQTLEQNHRALETVNRLDLHACFNLLLLNPESTLDDFRANVAFLRSYSINPMNFCRTEIYAGTPLEKRLRRERRLLGNYWGYNYIISDPRAQTAFELMYAGLEGRHFGEDCVHHLAMRVDFECQLLKHFRGCPDSLHKKAKEFVRNVNLNSCDYLDEIADAAATGFGSSEERSKFLAGLRARVAGDNHCFAEEGMALVARVNQDPQSQVGRARMWQQEAAVLLSSLALVATSCSPIFTEMAPRPSTTDNQLQQRILERALLPKIAPLLANPAPLRVYAVVDESGKCASLGVFNLGTHQAVTVPPELLQKLDFPELKNTRWDVTFSSEEVSRFFQSTHIFEMAPLPNRGK
jgi:hypothetical protein